MNDLKLPIPALPTTAKEFLRCAVYVFGLITLELFTGLGSFLVGTELKIPIDHWRALALFVGFLVPFSLADAWQRRKHLEEQAGVAEEAVKNGTVPPEPPEADSPPQA